MVLVKILKRKDASSIIVAVVLAMLVGQFIQTITNRWAIKVSTVNYGAQTFHWKEDYLLPIVWLILELVVLEVLCWLYIGCSSLFKKK